MDFDDGRDNDDNAHVDGRDNDDDNVSDNDEIRIVVLFHLYP